MFSCFRTWGLQVIQTENNRGLFAKIKQISHRESKGEPSKFKCRSGMTSLWVAVFGPEVSRPRMPLLLPFSLTLVNRKRCYWVKKANSRKIWLVWSLYVKSKSNVLHTHKFMSWQMHRKKKRLKQRQQMIIEITFGEWWGRMGWGGKGWEDGRAYRTGTQKRL